MRIHIPGVKFAPYFLEYEEVDSTQDIAFEILEDKNVDSCVVFSYIQRKGRGRKSSYWFSPYGGLWFSIGFKDVLPKNLYLVSVISVSNFLEREFEIENKIKIPNDIVVNDKKICGILVESKKNLTVSGIGLNLNIKEFPDNLKEYATSVYLLKNKEYDLKKTLLSFLEEFLKIFSNFSFKKLFNSYIIKTQIIGKRVRFEYMNKKVEGKVLEIAEDFEIFIENKGKFEIGIIRNFEEI